MHRFCPQHILHSLLLACILPGAALAAVMVSEEFQSDPGWLSRDGEMAVSWSSGTGNFPGSMQGTFAEQITPFPEIDAFRIDFNASGGPWVGDYYTLYPSNTLLTFDFMADQILPSSLIIQISDGFTTFIRNLLPQVGSLGSFNSISIPLAYDGNWLGGSALQFSNVFGSVSFIDLQLTRNSTIAQNYYVDNFAINNDDISNPPGPSTVVPEASTIQFAALAAAVIMFLRRSMQIRQRPTLTSGHEINRS